MSTVQVISVYVKSVLLLDPISYAAATSTSKPCLVFNGARIVPLSLAAARLASAQFVQCAIKEESVKIHNHNKERNGSN